MNALCVCLATMLAVSISGTVAKGETIDFSEVPTIHFPLGGMKIAAYPAFEDYAYVLLDICEAVGFTIESGDCLIFPMNATLGGNAIATIVDGNKLIVYDRALAPLIGFEGAEMVIAHELGHHRCGHLARPGHPRNELEADAFAGAVAKLRGHPLIVALSAAELFDLRLSLTHPDKAA